jgi:hypothetical protein
MKAAQISPFELLWFPVTTTKCLRLGNFIKMSFILALGSGGPHLIMFLLAESLSGSAYLIVRDREYMCVFMYLLASLLPHKATRTQPRWLHSQRHPL